MKPPTPRTPSAPRSVPAAPPPALRPSRLDYFLILLGCALSLYLVELSGYQAHEAEDAALHVPLYVQRLLPRLLFLPLGILLFWPVFYGTQRILGRPQALTLGEWLWGVAWLAAVALVTWIAWQAVPESPELIRTADVKHYVFAGYAVGVLSLAVIAVVVGLLDVISRVRKPWTHAFGLVLMIWPALPLIGLLVWKLKVEAAP